MIHTRIEIYCAGEFLVAISGPCHGVNELFALLGCYTALVGSYTPINTRTVTTRLLVVVTPVTLSKIMLSYLLLYYITSEVNIIQQHKQ
jgi:hypothetical protein